MSSAVLKRDGRCNNYANHPTLEKTQNESVTIDYNKNGNIFSLYLLATILQLTQLLLRLLRFLADELFIRVKTTQQIEKHKPARFLSISSPTFLST